MRRRCISIERAIERAEGRGDLDDPRLQHSTNVKCSSRKAGLTDDRRVSSLKDRVGQKRWARGGTVHRYPTRD